MTKAPASTRLSKLGSYEYLVIFTFIKDIDTADMSSVSTIPSKLGV